jgi:hypothetical protein
MIRVYSRPFAVNLTDLVKVLIGGSLRFSVPSARSAVNFCS